MRTKHDENNTEDKEEDGMTSVTKEWQDNK